MPVIRHRITSRVLEGNPLGDPITRDLLVYVPPDYDAASSKRWPTVLAIVGFTGTGGSLFNIDPLTESLHDKLDRMIATGACPPIIVAAPDCFTRVGGNQYIHSAGTGRYSRGRVAGDLRCQQRVRRGLERLERDLAAELDPHRLGRAGAVQ